MGAKTFFKFMFGLAVMGSGGFFGVNVAVIKQNPVCVNRNVYQREYTPRYMKRLIETFCPEAVKKNQKYTRPDYTGHTTYYGGEEISSQSAKQDSISKKLEEMADRSMEEAEELLRKNAPFGTKNYTEYQIKRINKMYKQFKEDIDY